MGRRILIAALAVLLAFQTAEAANPKARKGLVSSWGWYLNGLTFWAPFDNPADPLNTHTATGSLSMVRETTGTFEHPFTGLVTTSPINTLRIESQGALIEGTRTNILLWSRALDNAAWTKTNTTAGKTITGEDGVSNSASWVAASSNGGTVKQAVTIVEAAFTGSVSIKRITGTGTVKVSMDGGSTYGADLAASLSTSAWYRTTRTQTVANPSLTIQLGTSGDNVAIDYAGIEAGAFASSRIPTTTVAVERGYDLLYIEAAGNMDFTEGTFFTRAHFITSRDNLTSGRVLGLAEGGDPPMLIDNEDNPVFMNDGTGSTGFDVTGYTGINPVSLLAWWSAAQSRMGTAINGTNGAGAAFDGSFTGGVVLFGCASTNLAMGWLHLKDAMIWNRPLSVTERTAITN
jgi:hypothetical protein